METIYLKLDSIEANYCINFGDQKYIKTPAGNLLLSKNKKLIESRMKGRYLVDDIVNIMINLNSGESEGKAWGCDLSKKYVEINSEYTT